MKDLIKIAFFCFLVIALLIPLRAHGLVITYEFNYEFSEGEPPHGPRPWVIASFDDEFEGAEENEVMLTVSALNLVQKESITGLYFNFHPDHDPGWLTFIPIDNSDTVPNGIFTGTDAFRAAGNRQFDILFNLPPPGLGGDPAVYFTGGEQIVYLIRNDSEDYVIDANSFNFESVRGDEPSFNAVAHIQRIGPDEDLSGWIAPHCVPEPATVLLLGFLLIGFGVLKRRL